MNNPTTSDINTSINNLYGDKMDYLCKIHHIDECIESLESMKVKQ